MNVFVIGGTGFIGTKISEALASDGHSVRVLSPSAGRTVFTKNITGFSGHVADKGEVAKHAEWADLVIHLASTTNPKTSFSDPYHDLSSNLLPMVQLLELLKGTKKKLVFCSSGGAVYGSSNGEPIAEDHAKLPATSYGIVKSTMESFIQFYHKNHGLPYLIIRPSNVYGPKLRSIGEQGIISTLIYNAFHKQPTRLWANLSNIRDYIFIDDFIRGFNSLIVSGAEGDFNIGSGKGYSLREIIDAVKAGFNYPVNIEAGEHSVMDEPANILDISKIKKLTGWEPRISLEEGIKKITAHFPAS